MYKFISQNPKSKYDNCTLEELSAIKYFEKIDKFFDEKLKILENNLHNEIENENEHQVKAKNKILFEKSTIIENDYERRLLEFFIKENDKTKMEINPKLWFGINKTIMILFKSSVDGDNSKKFHEKCNFCGATLTIVRSDKGKRFGGYTSISWDKGLGKYYKSL